MVAMAAGAPTGNLGKYGAAHGNGLANVGFANAGLAIAGPENAANAANLDARSQETQMRIGLVALAGALVVALLLARSGAPPAYRALGFIPFFFATNGVLTALYGVCGFTAMAGRRLTNDGVEVVANRKELAGQRRSGLRVIALSLAIAALVTTLFVFAT